MSSLFVNFAFIFLASLSGFYPETESPKKPADSTLAGRYRTAAEQIVAAAMAKNEAYDRLEHLCLAIGHRLSGSPSLERAIDWALETMKIDGQEDVRREKVMVPHWVRGKESASMLKPRLEPLVILGLGGSVGTPPEGITAEVVVVANEEELDAAAENVKGKIVLFNNPMPPYDPEKGSGYGETVRFRSKGPKLVAEKGGMACLVRSVTAKSLRTPHTGATRYADDIPQIPAAAITTEDAETIARLTKRGVPVVVNLKMDAQTLPDAESANAVAELRGREEPEEIVVIGGHIDSWDVGHGAHDDGGGCIMAIEAIHVLRKLNLIPRRTIRVVLWTNEENGLRGGRTYAQDHADELMNHVAAIESDSGVFAPRGFSLDCADESRRDLAIEQMNEILSLLPSAIGPLNAEPGGGGADISPMKDAGVMLMGHRVEGSTYFDYHHTPADTIDKVDPAALSQNVAVMAFVAYVLADMEERIGEKAPAPAEPDRATR